MFSFLSATVAAEEPASPTMPELEPVTPTTPPPQHFDGAPESNTMAFDTESEESNSEESNSEESKSDDDTVIDDDTDDDTKTNTTVRRQLFPDSRREIVSWLRDYIFPFYAYDKRIFHLRCEVV